MDGLDDRLRQLLGRPGDPAGAAARVLLEALLDALDRRAGDSPDEPGVRALAAGIGELLAGVAPVDARAARRSETVPGPEAVSRRPRALRARPAPACGPDELAAVWVEATEGLFPGPAAEPAAEDVAERWGCAHALTLRLPDAERTRLLLRLQRWARDQGHRIGPGAGRSGAPAVDVVPALADADGRTVHGGLSLGPVPGTVGGSRRTPAEVTSGLSDLALAVDELISIDPRLSHCLQRIEFLRVRSLHDPVDRETYRQELHNRRVALYSEARTPARLEAAVDLHEAVCSVVHLPPAPEDSWWGRLRGEAHQLVATAGRSRQRHDPRRSVRIGRRPYPVGSDIPLKVGGRGDGCWPVSGSGPGWWHDRPGRVIYGC
jgi:hypothetical protein